jgi:low affinity Fe/Cu permease
VNVHYHHPDIAVTKRRIIGRVVTMLLVWAAAFVWCITGD